MLRIRSLIPVLACLGLVGCLEFRAPLGPVSASFIDARLVGAWSCVNPDDSQPDVLTIRDFDGLQYYMHFADADGGEPGHARAHASRVGETAFLNVVEMGKDESDPDWTILEYTFVEATLRFRAVDVRPFADVREDPAQVRDLLEQHLEDPTFFADLFACTKVPSVDSEDASS